MAKWKKDRLRLAKDHAWRAKPGYQIVVLDRGAVRFDVPQGWVIGPGEGAVELRDRPSPDDLCLIQASVVYAPPGTDWRSLPLAELFEAVTDVGHQEVIARGPAQHEERPGLELAWRETRYVDPGENREAHSCTLVARGADIHAVITISWWPEDAARFAPVWDELLRSLRLGEYRDATTGRRLRWDRAK